jgi:peptide/nickel transport system substrate-binding protein
MLQIRAIRVFSVVALAAATGLVGMQGAVAAAKPQSGGTVTMVSTTFPGNLDPARGTAAPSRAGDSPVYLALFDALLSMQANGTVKPRIGTLTSKDSTVWTLKLRSGVKFSDGTDYDAAAVKANWDRMNKLTTSPGRVNFANWASWVVTDPLTLTITLKTSLPDFPFLFSTWAQNYNVSPKQFTADDASVAKAPIGAGAYLFKQLIPLNSVTMTKNPNYYGKTYIDTVVFKIIADASQEYATFQSGGADLARTSDPSIIARAKQDGVKITNVEAAGGYALTFQASKPPFDDLRARQAVAYAFDTAAMNKAVWAGAAVLTPTLFPKTSPYYDASIKQLQPNDKKAQALLDELAAAGKPLNIELTYSNDSVFLNVAQWLQTKLATFKNVTMKLNPVPAGAISPTFLIPGNFQVAIQSVVASLPSEFAQYFQTGGGKNYGRFSNVAMDAAMTKVSQASTTQARQSSAKEFQKVFVEQVPNLLYQATPHVVLVSKFIKGYNPLSYHYNVPDWTTFWKSGT